MFGDEDVLRLVMPAIRADYTAIETYTHRAGPELRCPVTVLVGDDDPLTTVDEARDWARHTSGPTEVQVFRGGHFFLLDHQATVIAALTRICQAP